MGRRLTGKQVRYLWAIGYFKGGGHKGKGGAPAPKTINGATHRSPEEAAQHLLSVIKSTESAHAARTDAHLARIAQLGAREKRVRAHMVKNKGDWDVIGHGNKLRDKIENEIGQLKATTEGRPQMVLGEITKQQGFDGKPTLASPEKHAELVAAGHQEIFRGVKGSSRTSSHDIHEQLRSGPFFMASGIYGMGTYFAPTHDGAVPYSDNRDGGILKATINPEARVIMHSEALRHYQAQLAIHPQLAQTDESGLAAAMGYDIVRSDTYSPHNPGEHHRVLLNRRSITIATHAYSPKVKGRWDSDF